MPEYIEIRRTFKYRMYTHKRNRHLHDVINISGIIWNHCIALQRRWYRLTGGYISRYVLQKHIAKMRNTPRFAYWKLVGSQAVQEIIERVDKAYQRFFNKRGGKPRFKKVKKYKSFTLKQKAGWKWLGEGRVRILGRDYRFVESRPIEGKVKTVTVKRDGLGRLWICFSVIQMYEIPERVSTGRISDLGFGEFLEIMEHVARKKGVSVDYVDRWTPTTKTCSGCGRVKDAMPLHERTFQCNHCGLELDRDHNAARNIKQVGASTCSLEVVRREDARNSAPAASPEARIPRL